MVVVVVVVVVVAVAVVVVVVVVVVCKDPPSASLLSSICFSLRICTPTQSHIKNSKITK